MVTGAVPGRLKLIVLGPLAQFASVIAARRVQRPCESAHRPSPGLASTASAVLVTVKVWLAVSALGAALVDEAESVAAEVLDEAGATATPLATDHDSCARTVS